MGFLARIGSGFKKTGNFFRDGWLELKKVRWPNRKELVNYTLVVLGTVSLVAIFFAIVDLGISSIIACYLWKIIQREDGTAS